MRTRVLCNANGSESFLLIGLPVLSQTVRRAETPRMGMAASSRRCHAGVSSPAVAARAQLTPQRLLCSVYIDLDAYQAVFPVTGGSPFYVATRIMESNQTLVCSQPGAGDHCRKT